MTPQEQSVPRLAKFCQKRLHEIPIDMKRCELCRRAYEKNYRITNKERINARERELYLQSDEVVRKRNNCSIGGKATAIILRQQAIERYYANPKLCGECGGTIHPKEDEKIPQVKKRRFCSQKCASTFNGRSQRAVRTCQKCGASFTRGGDHKSWRLCSTCAVKSWSSYFENTTKGELFAKCSNWQSARSSIRKDADKRYTLSGRSRICAVCGYSRYVEIAHRKPVSSFPSTALISEINHIDNLCALCRNHHWEIDHGFLKFNAEWTGVVPAGAHNPITSVRTRPPLPDQSKFEFTTLK